MTPEQRRKENHKIVHNTIIFAERTDQPRKTIRIANYHEIHRLAHYWGWSIVEADIFIRWIWKNIPDGVTLEVEGWHFWKHRISGKPKQIRKYV